MGLNGCVVDSGDGVTHIIPVSHGCVIGSCIKHIPLAGYDVTKFIMNAIKDRKEDIDQSDLMAVAKEVKDTWSYVSADPQNEFKKFDKRVKTNPEKAFKGVVFTNNKGKALSVRCGYEVFMGPELLFKPMIVDGKWSKGIHTHIDECIQLCPIDARRSLYSNIVLSGGTTQTRGLDERVQTEMDLIVRERQMFYMEKTKHKAIDVQVNVNSN